MSIQIQEIFEYKNKNFTLLGNPLYHYFEKRKDINFELLSSGLSRGYQGTWTIKDNKLFLIKLYCANYCIEDIFNAKAPVLAEWFSGDLEVGIGNRRTVDYFFPKFEYYLGLEIKRGVITERKIIKRFFDEPVLEFGQYRGLTFQNVLYGKIINEKIAIHNYIETLVQFLTNKKFNKNLLTPSVRFDEQSNNIINMLKNHKFKHLISTNYIAIGPDFSQEELREDFNTYLSRIIAVFLKSDFENLSTFDCKSNISEVIAEDSILLNPDISYLIWALREVDFFSVPPDLLNKSYKINKLKSFEVNRLNSTLFEFKPIIEQENFTFPINIKEKNESKFYAKHALKYDSQKDYYIVDKADEIMLKDFGFYLSDNILNIDNSSNSFKSHNKRGDLDKQSYGEYSGTYAQSTEWLSDNFINDVLDGDPDAYWNID